jgi:hypothetical protein
MRLKGVPTCSVMRHVCVSTTRDRAVAMATHAKQTIKFDTVHHFVLSVLKAHLSPLRLPMRLERRC